MNEYLLYIIVSFAVSLVFGFVSIPYVISYCVKHKLYDQPNARKIHSNKIPRMGGICFLPSMTLALIIGVATLNNMSENHQVTISLWSACFFFSLALIYSIGILDDIIGINATIKFFIQIAAASLLPISGLYLNNLYGFLGVHEIPYWIGAPLTVFVIVFINNAMNLIDGIDGLSGMLSVIALGGFLIYFMSSAIWVYSILIAGMMGVIVAFLYFNLFGNPNKNQKVFMGDSGSLTIGFILGFLVVKYSMIKPELLQFPDNALVMACTLLVVPVFDVIRMILVRSKHKLPIFDADKNHIHHKLMRAGMTQHQALVCLVSLAVLYIIVNWTLSSQLSCDINVIILTDIIIWTLFHQIINSRIKKRGQVVFIVQEDLKPSKTKKH